MTIYTVQKGDTIDSIAEKFNIPPERLEQDNDLAPYTGLSIGQALMITYPTQTYTVKEGDTISSIADAFGISTLQLLRNNPQLSDRNTLNPGEELVISYDNKGKKIQVYGYANSFVNMQVLRKTLPFLTYISILNYRFDAAAELTDITDVDIIKTAKEYGVAPVMFVSSITQQGKGSYEVTHNILSNQELQAHLIDNILKVLKLKGYYGLELTLVQVLPDDLPLYVSFIAYATNRLNAEGYQVFVSLLPSTFGYQPGVNYPYSYYSDIGKAANNVILISYLWSSAFISQAAETNVDYLRKYLDFAVTQIPPDKIFIGFVRTAYEWDLPYVEGQTPGKLITNLNAISLANQLGVQIQFDEPTQTPFFYYNDVGIDHFVWFKDARSADVIVKLVLEYGLKGVAVWNIMYYYIPTWLVINSQYDIETIPDITS